MWSGFLEMALITYSLGLSLLCIADKRVLLWREKRGGGKKAININTNDPDRSRA